MNLWQRALAAIATVMPRRPGEMRVYVSPQQAGVRVTEDTALTFAAVWACISLISRTVAALPWQVYARSPRGRERLDNQVAWLLGTQPNPEMGAFAFREALVAHALAWGAGYAEIERDLASRPTALWLLTPDRVIPERADDGTLQYRVTNTNGQQTIIPAADMLVLHGLGFDGLTGYSVVQMAARSIGLGMAQDTFGAAFYQNGTVHGTLLEMPGTMNKEQIKETENYYNLNHGGPANAFKVKVAPLGVKVHGIGMPMSDAQFLESRKFSVTEVARWFGVPPHKIADLERSTNNNIEHQGIEFVTDAILPWCARLEQEADLKLFGARMRGVQYTKLNTNALMRGDSKARAEFYRTMVTLGVMSINEVRELEELNAIGDEGDQHLVQINQTTLERLVEAPAPQQQPQPTPDPGDAGDSGTDPEGADSEGGDPAIDNVIRKQALAWWRQQKAQA